MSLEHIFRNLNDIRVFDLIAEMQLKKEEAIDVDEIIDLLECGEKERIQIEDSINHLVEEHILAVNHEKDKWTSGCELCSELDRCGIRRWPDHESHKVYEEGIVETEEYYLANNDLTKFLMFAVIEASFLSVEEIENKKKIKDKIDMQNLAVAQVNGKLPKTRY